MASELRTPALLALGASVAMLCLGTTAAAQQEAADPAQAYTQEGADTCLLCHGEGSEFAVLGIFQTRHARASDPRTPFAGLQCEACHGPGAAHTGPEPMLNFGADADTPVTTQNAICEGCHADQAHRWPGSVHEAEGLPCAGCHQIHAAHDPVTARAEQAAVCYTCHARVRADVYKASSHPLRYAQMVCTDCHDLHESMADAQLVRATLNDTCYGCHAEKRGPFLWEHAPVAEDCSLCHRAHGSNHPALLTKRAPLLCQQCHSQAGHPSVAYTANGLPQAAPNAYLLAGGCTHCHSQVHGSNHPSGAQLAR